MIEALAILMKVSFVDYNQNSCIVGHIKTSHADGPMPVHIEIQEIRAFKAVYDEQGFKRAADKLFVTQSAVSQTIQNLEKKLDCLLMDRNPIKLTEAGIRFLNYAELVLGEEESVLTDVKNIKQGILGTLLLAMSGTVNHLFGEPLLSAYCSENPLTRLKINVMPSRQIISAVASDLWELGFGPFQQNMPEYFEILPLFSDERTLVISQHHPLANAEPEIILKSVPLLVSHLDDQDLRPAMDRQRDAFGTIWEINDTDLRMSLTAKGLGMSYVDQKLIEMDPKCASMIPLTTHAGFAKVPLTFGVYYRKGKQLSSGAERFLDTCRGFHF
ncbi:MAG: DNA-binding transcriptional LysR family regulator [Patiriisocius sp.]